MLSPDTRQILQRLEAIERRLSSIAPASTWPTVREACETYSVHRDTLCKLAARNVIRQSNAFPVRYYRPDLDRHFFGLIPEEMAWVETES